jgi:glutamine transport system substrate-binding protein
MVFLEDSYNKRNTDKIRFLYKKLDNFDMAFKYLDANAGNNSILYINSVSITTEREKRFDFSVPYFPIRPAAIAWKENKVDMRNIYDKSYQVGVIKNTVNVNFAKEIVAKSGQKLIYINENDFILNYLIKGDIDFYIGDAITPWINRDYQLIHIYKEFKEGGYAILYPKGSELKKKFDSTIKYIVSSPRYFRMVKKTIPNINSRYFERVKD